MKKWFLALPLILASSPALAMDLTGTATAWSVLADDAAAETSTIAIGATVCCFVVVAAFISSRKLHFIPFEAIVACSVIAAGLTAIYDVAGAELIP